MTELDVVTRLQQMAAHPHACDGADGHSSAGSHGDTADLRAARETIIQLQGAVVHRTVIGQATGIVMERFGMDSETAFGTLAHLSQQTNRKLYELACQLISSGDLPGLRQFVGKRDN